MHLFRRCVNTSRRTKSGDREHGQDQPFRYYPVPRPYDCFGVTHVNFSHQINMPERQRPQHVSQLCAAEWTAVDGKNVERRLYIGGLQCII